MWSNKDANDLYANDPPKLSKCIQFGCMAFISWLAVAAIGYLIRDYQCVSYILTYAVYWNVVTLSLNVFDFGMKNYGFYDWSLSEDILHFLTLLGGGPAIVLVMVMLKYNSKNPSFQETFFTWCSLSPLWMLFVLFIVYSYQHVFNEFFK